MDFLRLLSEIRTPALDAIFSFITYGGQEVFLLGIMCIFYWCLDKRFAYKMGFPYFVAGVTVNGIKIICRVDRPWIKDPSFKPVESAVEGATGYSFPSGHTFSATVLFTSFAGKAKKLGLKILFFVCIALIMLSRMYLGVHTPQDVLVSFAICLAITLVLDFIIDRITLTDKKRLVIVIAMTAYVAVTMLYSGILCKTGYVTPENTKDVFKMAGAALAFTFGWYVETRWIGFDPRACSLPKQILKIVIGVAGILVFKIGFKKLFGDSIGAGFVRYFLMSAWMIAGFPLIIRRFFEEKK